MSQLNHEQQAAVDALQTGNVAVLAGPGSGKTHTLAAAVRSVLASGHADVLCLTFTNKAADNLRVKLDSHKNLFVGTFHALAARLLTGQAEQLPIASQQAIAQVIGDLQHSRHFTGANARELSLMISRYKNGSLASTEAEQLVAAYDASLSERGLIDYDDLILRCLKVAKQYPAYNYIFVDEFQDTSPRQYELLQKLSDDGTKLFVIGDPQQSIYRFRGADGSVFARLTADFAPQRIHLQSNYRSAPMIVQAANKVFTDQPQQAVRTHAGWVKIIETLDDYSEVVYIVRTIEHALGGTEWHRTHHDEQLVTADGFQDFAVLYRTRRQGELLAKQLRAAGLPVQCLGEDSPYASPLAQLIKALFEYAVTPDDATKAAVKDAAERAKFSVHESVIRDLDASAPPKQLIGKIAAELNPEDDSKILQLENLASRFSDLETFLQQLDALADQAFFDPTANAVTLSTIHAAKGLEFRHIFVAGCNQGTLPSRRATETGALAEEQRLFYVAITRARDSLMLLYARQHGKQAVKPSGFLQLLQLPTDIDEGLATVERQRKRACQKRAQQRLF